MARLAEMNTSDSATIGGHDRSALRLPLAENNVNNRTASRSPHKLPSTSTAKQGKESHGHAGLQSQKRVDYSDTKHIEQDLRCTNHNTGAPRQRSLKLAHVDSLLLPLVKDGLKARKTPEKQRCALVNGRDGCRATLSLNLKNTGGCGSRQGSVDASGDEGGESDGEQENSDSEADRFKDRAVRSNRNNVPAFTLPGIHHSAASEKAVDVIDLTSPDKSSSNPLVLNRTRSGLIPQTARRPLSSLVCDPFAVIGFSPQMVNAPAKEAPAEHVIKPPASPSKSKLNSPKKLLKIPQLQYRPSIDAFWSQEVVNTWNDEYSPRKALKLPGRITPPERSDEEEYLSPSMSPRKSPQKSLVRKDRVATEARKIFEQRKHAIAESFLNDLDREITGGEIKRLSKSSGGVQITWNKKLNSTAGRANWRREAVRSFSDNGAVITTHRHLASIEIAEKVIDDEHRLLNVLAHEYCHLTNFMISNVKDQPHGASFKSWAARVTKAFAHRGINVTTKHSYDISYKYAWACVNDMCGVNYTRHSRSIDPARHTCGRCKARLVQTRPVPRGFGATAKPRGEGAPKKSEYQVFVKEHFRAVKRELGPASPMKDVMKEVGARYRVMKEEKAKSPEEWVDENAVRVVVLDKDEVRISNVNVADSNTGEIDRVSRVLDFLTIRDD